MKISLILLFSLIFLFVLARLPLSIPPYLDFQVIYHADVGLLRSIPIYDHAAQVKMIAQFANVPPAQVFVLPFPYPPWYALSMLWVALLPIEVAARIWFGLNLIMLIASTWLLTDGWPALKRLFSFLITILFLPVLGSLLVGQYTFPVLLGAALLTFAIHRENVILTAIAAALLTFKPHLGTLILVIAVVYLWIRKGAYGRRSLLAIFITGMILFVIGFLASPLWPLEYFHSLTGFKDVSQCQQCNSASMALAELSGGGLERAFWIAAWFLILLAVWLAWRWQRLSQETSYMISAAVLVTLLVTPYLQNYDYILLLIPFFALAGNANLFDRLYLGFAFLIPLIGFGLLGSAGYGSLVFSSLILLLLVSRSLNLTHPGVENRIISK
jgi:hypothetical protein